MPSVVTGAVDADPGGAVLETGFTTGSPVDETAFEVGAEPVQPS